ncbi:hypothetical protein ACQEVF_51440 [Nonomuraea polychroma]|uniref:hypothetical protein n=1 Tax=Nonomuraea polychroma TaxID=46176 RepID=UPI003D8B1DA8
MPIGVSRTGVLVFFGVLVLAGAAIVALVVVRGSEDERFVSAAGEIEAVARTLKEGDRLGPRTIGGMAFEEVSREHGVIFLQRGLVAGLDPYGYVWSPQSDPARIFDNVEPSGDPVAHTFEHLHGAFYSWKGTH